MKLTRLRLVGFKSFVEPTDFLIEPGLTGVVGPNGCGKSNLVEALRWVMGESSHKNMRASGMDDVIFSGSGNRPARNTAEVDAHHRQRRPHARPRPSTMPTSSKSRAASSASPARPTASTARRCAPATCSSCSPTPPPAPARRPWCARARSARSSPPSPRRAGASWRTPPASPGLHSRRHEAELRLKAAEDNLVRVEDVLREIDAQIDSLQQQGRQASRYQARRPRSAGRGPAATPSPVRSARRRPPPPSARSRRISTRSPSAPRAGRSRHRARRSRPMRCRRCARRRLPPPRPCSGSPTPATSSRRRSAAPSERRAELDRHIAELERDIAPRGAR